MEEFKKVDIPVDTEALEGFQSLKGRYSKFIPLKLWTMIFKLKYVIQDPFKAFYIVGPFIKGRKEKVVMLAAKRITLLDV